MTECDGIKYNDLDWCEGRVQLPGIRPKVYGIAKREIVGFPTRQTVITAGMGDLATLLGSFTLAAGAFWREIVIIVDKSPVTSASQGTKPSKTFLNTGTFVHQGVDEDATGFAQQANNDDMVYAFQQKNGKFRILGNEMFQTNTDIAQNLGGAATDEMGTILTVGITDMSPAPFYNGQIVTENGIINEDIAKVESVTFTPNGGATTPGTTTVALATTTVGATVYYKIGTATTWSVYSDPIATTGWTGDTIVTAKARKLDMGDSDLTSATFTVGE